MNPLSNVEGTKRLNERELELGLVGTKSSWHNKYKDSAWLFVGGLPYDLTEGDIICVFSQYGEIVNINLVREKKTGKSKGYCFVCYEDQRSTVLAVDNFNGIKLLGRTLRVDHVLNYKMPKEDEDNPVDEITKKLREEGCAPRAPEIEEHSDTQIAVKKEKKDKKVKKKKKKEKKKNKEKKKRQESSSSSEGESEEVESKRSVGKRDRSPDIRRDRSPGIYRDNKRKIETRDYGIAHDSTSKMRKDREERTDRKQDGYRYRDESHRSRDRDRQRDRGRGSSSRSRSRDRRRSRSRSRERQYSKNRRSRDR